MKGTSRKIDPLVEQSLKNSVIRYRRLFEAAQDGILILDARTGMIEDVNPFLIKMLGYSREEFIKKKLWEVGAFRDMEASKDAFEALQDNEYIRYEDLPLKAKDGRLIQVEFISNVYLVGDEKVIQCDIHDITDHHRIVNALQGNEKRYHDLINQSPDGYFIIDLSGKILIVNKAMCKELEFSEEELLSMNMWDIIPERYLDQYRERLMKILKGESLKESAEYEVRGKTGTIHYVEVLSAPHYSGRDVIGFQGIARDITALKRAETALIESEERFRTWTENSSDLITVVGFDGTIQYESPSIEHLLGYKPEELLGTNAFDLMHPDDRQRVMEIFAQNAQKVGSTTSAEFRFRHCDGSWRLFEGLGKTYLNEQGQMTGLINSRDITERKQAEAAIREGQQRFSQVWEATSDAMALSDPDGIVLAANPAYLDLYGYKLEQVVGRSFSVIFPEEIQAQAVEQYKTVFTSEVIPPTFESAIRRADGSERIVESTVSFLTATGRRIAMLSTIRDITERRLAEKILYESEERFKNAFQHSAIGMALVSLEGKWLKVNSVLCSILGYSEDELLMKTFQDITHPDDLDSDINFLNQLLAGELKSYTMEKRYFHKEGKIIWVFLAVALARDNMGVPLYFISQIEDITDRKQAETEILQRLSELEMLYQGGLAFSSMKTSKAIAEKVIDLLDQKMDWHHTAIRLYYPESETFELLAHHLPNRNGREEHGATEEQLKSMQWADQGISGWVIQHGQVVRSNDLKNDPRYFETFHGLRSGLYVPIKINERVIGVISIESEQPQAFNESDEHLVITLAGQAAIAMDNLTLFDDLQRSNAELMLAYETTLEGWSHALDLRDKETEGHTQRVTEMAVKLARTFGLGEADLLNVRRGALLHDIGKMGVPDNILLKPGKLTDEEWQQMRMHPVYAYDLLSHIAYLHEALDIPYCHHEKWDGSGYPRGLKGDEIPLAARIFAVVDVWDALISERPYRAAWTREKAREHIRASAGTHFDPQVVNAFMQILN